jgi:transglutaminase-like putative cysteine protease
MMPTFPRSVSLGRVVPNDAASVLHNKFGDCKDKATLMWALLAAKGISSEQALINLGNAYTRTAHNGGAQPCDPVSGIRPL